MQLFKGLLGLLMSKKAMLCLIILAVSGVALFMGKLEGMYFSAIVATISTIYCWTTHKCDIASLNKQP